MSFGVQSSWFFFFFLPSQKPIKKKVNFFVFLFGFCRVARNSAQQVGELVVGISLTCGTPTIICANVCVDPLALLYIGW
jgi:hypothetical protein